jgi:hypothetical protein
MWRKVPWAIVLLAFAGASGCSGSSSDDDDDDSGSGVSNTKYLDELSAEEQRLLCEWVIAAQGGPGVTQCDSSTSFTTYTVEECATEEVTVHCTVAALEACTRSLEGDPCRLTTTRACSAYLECAVQNGG